MPKTKQDKQQGGFLRYTLRRGSKVVFIRSRDVAALSAYENEDSNTRLYVKNVMEELIVQDTPENVLKDIIESERMA